MLILKSSGCHALQLDFALSLLTRSSLAPQSHVSVDNLTDTALLWAFIQLLCENLEAMRICNASFVQSLIEGCFVLYNVDGMTVKVSF